MAPIRPVIIRTSALPRPRPLLRRRLAAALTLALTLAAGAASGPAGRTQAQLRALKERIERISHEVGRDAFKSDQLARDLRTAELAVASARAELETLRAQEADHAARRLALAAERLRISNALVRERGSLAGAMQVAYQINRREPLQLLFNQSDLASAQRMYTWYGYFARARAAQISGITQQAQRIDALDAALAQQAQALAQLRSARQQRLAELEAGRAQRQTALASLQTEARSRVASLARLRAQQADLEQLLQRLSRAVRPSAPADHSSAFGRLRGRLDWPVAGRVIASYGQSRASGVNWDGMVLATEHAAAVHAVAAGQVIYADWLPGLGLLAIVDHGGGYLSLYGYNEQLAKSVGEFVAAGETLAAAGDTGGRPAPQLYFEIRHDGKPVDPRPWFRRPQP